MTALWRLGIDFGTSTTVATLAGADGEPRPLVFDGSPLLSSAVFAGPDGTLLTGADALRAAAGDPARFEANPKRRVDDGTVWLGTREYPVAELVAAVLGRVRAEALRATGGEAADAVLTHPAAWGGPRVAVLAEAARRAGLGEVVFVAEPVAAAAHGVTVLDGQSRHLLVLDLGAGTFDVSLLRPAPPEGFEVVATDGLPDLGGLDLDALVVAHARSVTGDRTGEWERLDRPTAVADVQARRHLWQSARGVKEHLSRQTTADLPLPLLDRAIHLTRAEFEDAARPLIGRAVQTTIALLWRAGVGPAEIGAVLLVGGSTRIPLVAALLHRELGIAPTVSDQPELVVADGAIRQTPPPAVPPPPVPQPATVDAPRHGRRRVLVAALAVVMAAAATTTAAVLKPWKQNQEDLPPVRGAGRLGTPLTGHGAAVIGIAFSPDGTKLASTGEDRTIRLWDARTGTAIGAPLTGHTEDPAAVAFSPDGTLLASCAEDGVRLWDVAAHRAAGAPLTGHTGRIPDVRFSPDGGTLASSGWEDETVRLWDVRRRTPLGPPIEAWDGGVQAVRFAPDGTTVAVTGARSAQIWDIARREQLGAPLRQQDGVEDLDFSPDGTLLATVGSDERVHLWDVARRAETGEPMVGHTGFIIAVAFSADGRTLATAGADSVVRLWDVDGRTQIGDPLLAHTGFVTDVAFSPTGDVFASASVDGTVQLWRLTR